MERDRLQTSLNFIEYFQINRYSEEIGINEKSKNYLPVLMLFIGSLLVGFSMGLWQASLAAWLGPILFLRFTRDNSIGRGYLMITAAYILAFLVGFGQIWTNLAPLPFVPVIAVFYALLWSLPFLADRVMSPRLPGFSSTLVYPLAATTLEFVNNHINPIGVWGATGFTQYGNLPLIQLTSVTGMIGITFLMGWFASVANWAWEKRDTRAVGLRGLASLAAVLVAVYTFGYLRLNLTPLSENDETIRVAGISGEAEGLVKMRAAEAPDLETAQREVQSHWDDYFTQSVREAQAGTQLILWPEGAGMALSREQAASLTAQAQEVARKNGIYLAIGGFYYTDFPDVGQPPSNKLLLIDPAGMVVIDHIKYGANFEQERGNRILQFADTPYGVVSGVVCWDMDFPAVIQQAGGKQAGLILVPSEDWLDIDPVHSHMAVFRAIENGMSVVRQTEHGLSIAVDPYGRVLAQTDYFSATDRTMVAQVPVNHVTTIYTLFGRYLEWLAPIGLLFLVVKSLAGRNKV